MRKLCKIILYLFIINNTIYSQSTYNYVKVTEFLSPTRGKIESNLVLEGSFSSRSFVAAKSIILQPDFVATGNVLLHIDENSESSLENTACVENTPHIENISYYDGRS